MPSTIEIASPIMATLVLDHSAVEHLVRGCPSRGTRPGAPGAAAASRNRRRSVEHPYEMKYQTDDDDRTEHERREHDRRAATAASSEPGDDRCRRRERRLVADAARPRTSGESGCRRIGHECAPRSACEISPLEVANVGVEAQLGRRADRRTAPRTRRRSGRGGPTSPALACDMNTASLIEWVMNRPAKPSRWNSASVCFVEVLAGDLVDGAERLVEQEDRRAQRQRAGQRGAHLHAARERLGVVVLEPVEPDELDRLVGQLAIARPWRISCSSASSSTLPCTVRHGSSVASWKT